MSWEEIVGAASRVIAFFLGLIGNGIIAFIFLRNRNMRNVPNTYILSLVFANLLFVITCMPMLTNDFISFGAWAKFFYKLAITTHMIFLAVSAFTLIALSLERYSVIVRPIEIFQMRSQAVRAVVIIWVVACIFASHTAILNYIKHVNTNFSNCFIVILVLIYYIVPLVIITTCFILMAQKRSAAQRTAPVTQPLTGVLLIWAIVFFISITPGVTSFLVGNFNEQFYMKYYEIWFQVHKAKLIFRFFLPSAMPIIMYTMGGCNLRYLHSLPPPRPDPAPDTEMAVAPLCEDVCTEHGNVIVVL